MRIDTVQLAHMDVLYAAASGEEDAIADAAGRAFAMLEAIVPPKGRKAYGFWNPVAKEYRACYLLQPGDEPAGGLQVGRIPGGHYRRARIKDDEPFPLIPGAFDALEAAGPVANDGRPYIEFYRRHDEVDCLVPIDAPPE